MAITAGMTQQTFDALAEKLRTQEGIILAGTQGKVFTHGATVAWSYLGGVLSLDVIGAPPFMKPTVVSRLKDALAANGVVVR